MNTDKNQELAQLLSEALTDSAPAKPKLLDFIREELKEFIYEDMIESASSVIIGNRPPNGYPLKDLQNKLLEIAKDRGVKEAVSAFDKCTTDTQASFQYFALLEGITIDKKTQIFDGIRLVPPPASLSELSQMFNFTVNEWQLTPLSETTLLVVDASVSPIFHKPDPRGSYTGIDFRVKENSGKFPNFNESDIYNDGFYIELCQALSLACNSAVQILLQWRFLEKHEIFNLTSGLTEVTQLGRINQYESFAEVEEVERSKIEEQIEETKRIFDDFAKFNQNDREKLLIAVKRWIKSKTSQADIDRMIDLGIALESLYLPKGTRDQLTYQFRLRASRYLGETKADRKDLLTEFKNIYGCRSTAVHGGILKETVKIKKIPIPISSFIERAQDLCRDSILKILKEGEFPDWDDLMLD